MQSMILAKSAKGLDAGGEALAPLKPDTVRRTGVTKSTLNDSGAMLASLRVKADRRSAYISPTVPYAALINWGSPAKGYARREWLGISAKDATTIAKDADQEIARNVEVSLGARVARARGRGIVP